MILGPGIPTSRSETALVPLPRATAAPFRLLGEETQLEVSGVVLEALAGTWEPPDAGMGMGRGHLGAVSIMHSRTWADLMEWGVSTSLPLHFASAWEEGGLLPASGG